MRRAVVLSQLLLCAAVLASSGTSVFAQDKHQGLVALDCARVDVLGGFEGKDSLVRELVRAILPELQIDQNCPAALVLRSDMVHTSAPGAAVALVYGLEVHRVVLLPVQHRQFSIQAVVWRDETIWVATGPGDGAAIIDVYKRIVGNLFNKLRDDYILAGNKP